MTTSAKTPLPSTQDFELVATPYVAVPAALWGLAMLAVVLTTLLYLGPPAESAQAPASEEFLGTALGA